MVLVVSSVVFSSFCFFVFFFAVGKGRIDVKMELCHEWL